MTKTVEVITSVERRRRWSWAEYAPGEGRLAELSFRVKS